MARKSQILRKEQTLSSWIETRNKILSESSKLTKAQQNTVFLGTWSVKDILAHMIGWDHTNVAAIKSILLGQTPSFYQYHDRDWRRYNAKLVRKYGTDSFSELLVALEESRAKLLQFLQSIPPENFNKDFGARFRGYRVTIQRLMEAETGDEQTHYKQIISFFKESA